MSASKKHLTIRNQIIIITFAFTLFIGVTISIVSYHIYANYLEDNLISSTDTNLLFLTDYIENELDNIDQLVLYCQSNSTIGSFVESHGDAVKKRTAAHEILTEYCQNNASSSYLHRVVITNLDESYIQVVSSEYSSTIDIARELPKQDFYKQLLSSGYRNYTVGFLPDMFYPRRAKTIVPILKPITYKFTSDLGGYIFLEIDAALFSDALSNVYQTDGDNIYLTLGEHTYLYEQNSFTEVSPAFSYTAEETTPAGRKSGRLNRIESEGGTSHIVVSEEIGDTGCYVSQILSPVESNGQLTIFHALLIALFVELLLLGLLLNHILGRIINVPVGKIQNRLVHISAGDFSRDTSIEWNHEIGDIGRGVNDLAEAVNELIENKLAAEKEKRDLEYKMLQSQINPHFLYNTLNSIKWMASIQGATGIVDMTTALSRLLKSISKGTKLLIPLREELGLVEDYFTIQQYRYGGTLKLTIDVDEEILYRCLIIKFTLQPLVENAIFHGIEPTGSSGEITIHIARVPDDNIKIDITDNGVGMSEETIAQILNDETQGSADFFREIGISNVQKRLRYEFGESYGITINSVVGEYTTMSILLPMRLDNP